MSKHTPGPWHYRKCPCGMPQCRIYTVSANDSTEVTEFNEADARLAAASPDMLAALIDAVSCLEFAAPIIEAPAKSAYRESIIAAHAAIAKATGGGNYVSPNN